MTIIKRHQFLLTLIYLLFFLALGISFNRSPQVQTAVSQATSNLVYQGQRGWAKLNGTKAPAKPTNNSNNAGEQSQNINSSADTSNIQNKTNGGGRWATRHATVYVAIKNKTLRQATVEAIHAWNKTGAFTFKQINSQKQANVVVRETQASDGAAGLTKSVLNASTGYFIKVNVYLNGNYLLNPTYNYSHQRVVNTAEHELGHSIGLEHTNSASVMQPAGSFYDIQPSDVQAVRYIYSHKASPDNSNSDAYGQTNSSSNPGISNPQGNNNQ